MRSGICFREENSASEEIYVNVGAREAIGVRTCVRDVGRFQPILLEAAAAVSAVKFLLSQSGRQLTMLENAGQNGEFESDKIVDFNLLL